VLATVLPADPDGVDSIHGRSLEAMGTAAGSLCYSVCVQAR
jgi:hypothetical protein